MMMMNQMMMMTTQIGDNGDAFDEYGDDDDGSKKNERVSLQVISILGGVFVEQSASAFGIFKFVQSLASAT